MRWICTLATAARMTVLTAVLTGLAYPMTVTLAAGLLFPDAAQGSLVREEHGRVVGSVHIGQHFSRGVSFQPRPSAAGQGYDGAASGGSNLGPTSRVLSERARLEVARLVRDNPGAPLRVPAVLVATSASGLDPDLPPETALWPVGRVAAARGLDADRVASVVRDQVISRDLGFLGEPRVNVLKLNVALDRQFGRPGDSP
ncbi:MAG TPA: potassium-transporting ATPase subunit KdpC [Myxococcota bacterium]|nr:potassium-transporting ATPase subunit KdpC [Myxococcota bacterium]